MRERTPVVAPEVKEVVDEGAAAAIAVARVRLATSLISRLS